MFGEIKKAVEKESLRFTRNRKMIDYCSLKYDKNGCNLNYCNYPVQNIGDMLSPVIVDWMLKRKQVKGSCKGKHLYAVGSIISFGYSDAVIWGSGILGGDQDIANLSYGKAINRKLDVRAVRGPRTRNLLTRIGYDVPEIYGDPAILMPLIYEPCVTEKRYQLSVIIHMNRIPSEFRNRTDIHFISPTTSDYKKFIDEILGSEKIISSSLHGIILSEVYGVPATLILDDVAGQVVKFYDYYNGTGREDFDIASSLKQAMQMEGSILQKDKLQFMQAQLLEAFPYDLWEESL